MKEIARYFTSTNYDDFVMILGNRRIDPNHVKKLGKEYEADGGFREEIRVNPTKVDGKWVKKVQYQRMVGTGLRTAGRTGNPSMPWSTRRTCRSRTCSRSTGFAKTGTSRI